MCVCVFLPASLPTFVHTSSSEKRILPPLHLLRYTLSDTEVWRKTVTERPGLLRRASRGGGVSDAPKVRMRPKSIESVDLSISTSTQHHTRTHALPHSFFSSLIRAVMSTHHHLSRTHDYAHLLRLHNAPVGIIRRAVAKEGTRRVENRVMMTCTSISLLNPFYKFINIESLSLMAFTSSTL